MGISLNQIDSKFTISADKLNDECIDHLILYAKTNGEKVTKNNKSGFPLPLNEIIQWCIPHWSFKWKNGAIIGISFCAEKYGWGEEDDLEALSKFVDDGSYIEMMIEDGTPFKWVFSNGQLEQKYGKIVYE